MFTRKEIQSTYPSILNRTLNYKYPPLMKCFILLPFLLCCCFFSSFGQEQLGLRTENYAGINSVFLNPANNLTTPFQWDVNLLAVGQFIDNNFGGFQNAGIGDLLNDRTEIFLATDFPSDQQFPAGAVIFDFNELGKDKFATVATIVTGPAFLLNFEKHSFGLFTNFRVALGGQRIPAVLGYYDYQSVLINEDYSLFPSGIAGMAWSELGFNYLFKAETSNGDIGIGVNLKYLQGYEAFFLRNNRDIRVNKLELDSLNFENGADISFGFTNSSIDEEAVNLQESGTGFGFDIGLTYASPDYTDGDGIKLGVSILDIGKISFDENAENHRININEPFNFNPRNLRDVTGFRDGLAQLNEELFSDTTTTFIDSSFEVSLPTALSLQADIAIQENLYVNATLIQRIPLGTNTIERGNLFALTPRYESRWISGFLPISIYNWQNFQIGAAVRLAFLTIGTENIGSFFGQKNLTGTDFYAAIKINPFKLGWKNGGGKRGKAVKCYEF